MIYSIGYQNIEPADLVGVVSALGGAIVVDCRANPMSRKRGWGNLQLDALFKRYEIDYRRWGAILGGRGNTTDDGIDRLVSLYKSWDDVVCLCLEESPNACHRHHDVANRVIARGLDVVHVIADAGKDARDAEVFLASELNRCLADGDDGYECVTLGEHLAYRERKEPRVIKGPRPIAKVVLS
jgi:uncharacterized protein (DUF488 family)